MSARDFECAKAHVLAGVTADQVERLYAEGRLSELAHRWLHFAARWAAVRFTGSAGACQDRLYSKMGHAAVVRRIARVRRLFGLQP